MLTGEIEQFEKMLVITDPVAIKIHGIGSGVLKDMTKLTLSKNKNVSEFAICYNNVGCTIVRIIV